MNLFKRSSHSFVNYSEIESVDHLINKLMTIKK